MVLLWLDSQFHHLILLLLLLLLRRWNETSKTTMDQLHISSSGSTTQVPSPVIQPAPVSKSNEIPEKNPYQPPIPYPSRLNKDKLQYKPEKLGDLRKFLIPCDFSELEECLALADLGASINLMPLSVWKKLMLPKLTPTRMTLELANRSVAYPVGIAEDVFVQVGKFTFLVDFVVVNYDVDPLVPLRLGRPFLRMARALVNVHGEELTLRVDDEKSIFNVESTFPTPSSDPVVVSHSPSLTPFGDNEFLLEETNAFLALDDSIPPEIDNGIYDSEGDILFLKKLLNDGPTKDLPPKELKNDKTEKSKSSNEEPLELELKDLPPHLEYAFLEGTLKLPVIIAKDLKREEKDQFNSHEDINDLVPILRVSKKPLDSYNPIFDIQNEESDESKTETKMEEVQIPSSQSTAQIPPPYGKLNFDLTMPNLILTFSQYRYGIFGSHYVFDILGPRLLFF
ncbi:reverse transcriptase domain-containing protein [Tanacetum coccineum]